MTPFKNIIVVPLLCLMPACAFAATQDGDAPDNDNDNETWSIHGQATVVYQQYPSFPSRYSGVNSIPAKGGEKESSDATLFLGRKLWEGGEIYIDPEITQGAGIGNSHGLGGFSNGDANAEASATPYWNIARLYLHQTFGFGGPTEKITPDANQLAATEDVSRISFTLGKLGASDFVDNNAYSHDPRTQFLNWSMTNSAAWDYPSDQRGYTEGGGVELNQENWTLRYGAFLEPEAPSGLYLAHHGLNSLGQVAELEERYTLRQQPGKIRFLSFYNRDRAGNFSDALALPGNVNTAISAVEQYGTPKYGFAVNTEQQLTEDLGAFVRLSWNDGHTEDWSFAQVDESISGGISMQGTPWGRSDDTLGVALAFNGISRQQQQFLQNGGTGINLGDGRLNYGVESIFETFYAFMITEYLSVTPDYQFIVNPGYNQVRGPVNIFTGRMHVEF